MQVLIQCPSCQSESSGETASDSMALCPECGERFLDDATSVTPGTPISKYTVTDYLGLGQLGETHVATDESNKATVVLKFLNRRLKVEDQLVADTLNRVMAVGMVNSLSAPQSYETFGEHRMLVQPYVKGETLEAIVRRDGTMDEAKALDYVRQAAIALKHAWDADALPHRYLKPANIMVAPDDSVVVMDMGMAELVGEGRGIWAPGMEFGTAHYLSPEQAWDAEIADFRADIYGLGAILYFLLTGRPPYTGTNPAVYAKLVKPDPVVSAGLHNMSLTTGCTELIAIMMSAQPHERHESWDALLSDFDRVMTGQSPSRRPATPPDEASMSIGSLKRMGAGGQKGLGNHVHLQTAPPTELVSPDDMQIRAVRDETATGHKSVYNLDVAVQQDMNMSITDPRSSRFNHLKDEKSKGTGTQTGSRDDIPPIQDKTQTLTLRSQKRLAKRKKPRKIPAPILKAGLIIGGFVWLLAVVAVGLVIWGKFGDTKPAKQPQQEQTGVGWPGGTPPPLDLDTD